MDILASGETGIFWIFGVGFIGGTMFATLISMTFDWINNRTRKHQQQVAHVEIPSTYQV